jgi:lipopolysaccharide assembly protein A
MTYISWFFRIVLFLLLLGFAIKNSEIVTLNYYLDYQWRAPLVLILLAFLLVGVVIGLLAASTTVFRQRREINSLKREARARDKLQAQAQDAAMEQDRKPA